MEGKRQGSFTRQISFSRKLSVAGPLVVFARWKKLLCIGVFFISGLFCGHLIHQFFMPVRSSVTLQMTGEPPSGHIMKTRGREMGRPGMSIKKDMSIQFRDYIPRLIFINCGGTVPVSLKLFVDTYPQSYKFVLYSFISDISYKPLYKHFKNLHLYAPLVCSTKNQTIITRVRKIGADATTNVTISTIDIATWIKETIHPDDHVVFKIDMASPEGENSLVRRIMEVDVLEWIDSFYTTTKIPGVIEFERKQFSVRDLEVHTWDDKLGSYSDFDKLNSPRIPHGGQAFINGCGKAEADRYSLILFGSEATPALNIAVDILLEASEGREKRLPMALFLPIDFIKNNQDRLAVIFARMEGGLFYNESLPVTNSQHSLDPDTDGKRYFPIRNTFVAAENRFTNAGIILQFVLIGRNLDSDMIQKIIKERHYNVFGNVMEIVGTAEELFVKGTVDLPSKPSLQIPAIDISKSGAETLVLHLLGRNEHQIMTLTQCLKNFHQANSGGK